MRGKRYVLLEFYNSHVLNEDRINMSLLQILQEMAHIVELIIIDDGVDGDIDLNTKGMRIVAEFPDIIDTIAYSCPGTKTRRANIHGISTMIDGGDAIFKILSWGK